MARLELTSGGTTNHSVFYFSSKIGVEASRLPDGSIEIKEMGKNDPDSTSILILVLFFTVLAIIRKLVLVLKLPIFIYHIPALLLVALFFYTIIVISKDKEQSMYHGAEHKVYNWYLSNIYRDDIKTIQMFSRFNQNCGSNFAGTFILFNIISSLSLIIFNYHISGFIIILAPLIVYKFFPFNIIGYVMQYFITSNPTDEHIEVALAALRALLEKAKE